MFMRANRDENMTGLIFGTYFNHQVPDDSFDLNVQLEPNKPYWMHFDYSNDQTRTYLESLDDLPESVTTALLNEETRPRATIINKGMLISLRGVNLSPGCNPEDMVSIRIWFDSNRILSTRKRVLLSVQDIISNMKQGTGPNSASEFIVTLTRSLMARMTNTIEDIEDRVAQIEESILTNSTYALRNEIADSRRQIISLRRYLAPQREAMLQLLNENIGLFNAEQKVQLRETTDHLIRYIEDLESIRDRASVTQEELHNRLAEQMNNRMYVLSIVAAIFLPLGFLTGLLGINVGGIPGSDDPNAFYLFIIFLLIVVIGQVILFKKNKWF